MKARMANRVAMRTRDPLPTTTPDLHGWLLFTAAICTAFGVGALLFPERVGALFGSETNPNGLLWARYYGSAILFAGYISWFARNANSVETLRLVALSLFLLFTVNLGISLYALAEGLLNSLHWTTIAGQVLLSGVWGYYRFKRLSPSTDLNRE